MDITNGDVLSLVSTPGFDPNLFNVGIKDAQYHSLLFDDHTPLTNKAISGVYPPGSTFKPTMALACVENGLSDMQVNCTGQMKLGNNIFHCWGWIIGGHGHVDLRRGIEVSCDIFFYEAARRLGIDKMEQMARIMGWGAPTGIEIPGEASGFFPSREWKRARFGQPWQEGESLNTGIGQGYDLSTPLQLCTVAARIASGNAVLPRVTRVVGPNVQQRPTLKRLPISDGALQAVQSGMNAVCNEPGGTAYPYLSHITQPGYEIAGKTGTAQVHHISKEERDAGVRSFEAKLPWKLREHALFMAYAPVSLPRYAASIVLEHGSVVSHPHVVMLHDILLFAQRRQTAMLPTAYPVNAAGLVEPQNVKL
jgi:penicillin-binding protein 2